MVLVLFSDIVVIVIGCCEDRFEFRNNELHRARWGFYLELSKTGENARITVE